MAPVFNNTVTRVEAWSNRVARPPAPQGIPRKGISLTGGFANAQGNRVTDIRLVDNLAVDMVGLGQKQTVEFSLRDAEGSPLVSGTRTLEGLAGGARIILTTRDLMGQGFAGGFRGSLTVHVRGQSGKLAVAAVGSGPQGGSPVPLPVVPLR